MFPKSTHETFAQKLYQTFKSNKRFIKPKLSRTDFTISHYAGEVKYLGFIIWAYFFFFLPFFFCWVGKVIALLLVFEIFPLFAGDISSQSLFGQKQRLCCSWAPSFVDCRKVLFCGRSLSTASRHIKDNQILFHRITLQGNVCALFFQISLFWSSVMVLE